MVVLITLTQIYQTFCIYIYKRLKSLKSFANPYDN